MRIRRGLLLLGLLVLEGAAAHAQRLPGGVRPIHYALILAPDLAKARFTGAETIDVVLDQPSSTITLNAAEIDFGTVTASPGHAAAQHATVSLDAAKEQATLTFAQPLPAGPVTLHIPYTGILNDKLRGFYLSKTKLRNYGVTQFEATDARRAFPSFDEPALKATFAVTLIIDAADIAISNMQIVSDHPGPIPGKHTVAFATTPTMSTYLVAWLVGDFQCSTGKSEGVRIRACATPDKVKLTPFAVEAAKWDLKHYNKYFGIKYPLKKLDLVAIPDFESGAMENFGCITFRETELLVDAKDGSLEAKKEVAATVAHEMSHQWFGDLVTPAWWNDLWLNEGFATWMETKVPAIWQPKWGIDDDAAVDLNHTLDEDAARTTHAVRAPAETPAEINALFDDISYGKAGAVIAMVEHWVGPKVFRKGIQSYLAAHLYANATGPDFWTAEARVSGLPVDAVMRSFIEQPGVPLVSLAATGPGASVRQQRFFLAGPQPGADESWTIPLCFNGAGCQLLRPGSPTLAVPAPRPVLYANAADKGYYRTEYSPALLQPLVAHVETALTPPERIELLGDTWAMVEAGQGDMGRIGDFLDLALAVRQDPDATVLGSALDKIDTVSTRIATDADRERLNAVLRRELAPVYAALGGPSPHESEQHADLRVALFEALGEAKDPAVLAAAHTMTQQIFAGKKVDDNALADTAVAIATVHGDADSYGKMLEVSRTATDPDLKEAALRALTGFHSPLLVTRTLLYALSGDVRNQDTRLLITPLLTDRDTQDLAWEFVQQHWSAIEAKATEGTGLRMIEATSSFCSAERRDEVASFFAQHPVDGGDLALSKTLDSINDCIRLRARQEPNLRQWLAAHSAQSPPVAP